MITLKGKYAIAYVMIDDVESECISQIYEFLNHPMYNDCKIVIMPDTHGGKGSVIGFTMHILPEICPNIVGVDIACGILSIKLSLKSTTYFPHPDRFNLIDKIIRENVPLGFNIHSKPLRTMEHQYPYKDATIQVNNFINRFNKMFETDHSNITFDYEYYVSLCNKVRNPNDANVNKMLNQVDCSIGTLGGGNHFIEIGEDTEKDKYITVHTGSRNFGNRVADYFQKKAQSLEYNKVNNKDLAYLKSEDAMEYYIAMNFVQKFAQLNREIILHSISIKNNFTFETTSGIESIHNFIDFHDMILRKGAIRSYKGEMMVIPFNMRDGIAICEGKSNSEWNFSAPHGAGRTMSRGKAKRNIDLKTFVMQMKGIYSSSIGNGTLDEAPDAYKPMQIIIDAIEPTVNVIKMIKPILSIKG